VIASGHHHMFQPGLADQERPGLLGEAWKNYFRVAD
jgi:hypothetical protein